MKKFNAQLVVSIYTVICSIGIIMISKYVHGNAEKVMFSIILTLSLMFAFPGLVSKVTKELRDIMYHLYDDFYINIFNIFVSIGSIIGLIVAIRHADIFMMFIFILTSSMTIYMMVYGFLYRKGAKQNSGKRKKK